MGLWMLKKAQISQGNRTLQRVLHNQAAARVLLYALKGPSHGVCGPPTLFLIILCVVQELKRQLSFAFSSFKFFPDLREQRTKRSMFAFAIFHLFVGT